MTQFEGRPYFSQALLETIETNSFLVIGDSITQSLYFTVGHRQTVVAFEILKAYVFRGSVNFFVFLFNLELSTMFQMIEV